MGNKDHLSALEPLFKDDATVQQFFVGGRTNQGVIKVKDIALAMTIHINGKNPKDYGFGMWQVHPNQMLQYHTLGFATEDERTKAFKKWADENTTKK